MISGLYSGETQSSSEVEMEGVVQQDDWVEEMDAYAPAVNAVHNDWRGSYSDKFLGMVSAVSMGVGAVMMVGGSVIMGDGEKEVHDGVLSINNTVTQQPINMTEVVKALDMIKEGNSETALGARIMAFGAGCGFMGFGMGVEFLRRRLCGGPPRQ